MGDRPSRKVVVLPTFIEGLTAMRMEIAVDGRPASRPLEGSVEEASRTGREPTTTLEVGPGLHTWTASGDLTFGGGRSTRVHGRGAVAWRDSLWSELTGERARRAPVPEIVELLGAVGEASGRESEPRLRTGATVRESAVVETEKRLGVRLPATCRRLLETFGPFRLMGLDDDGLEEAKAALYAPEDILSVPEWRARVLRSPLGEGDSDRARANVAKLAGDFVIGHTFDTVWVVRARTHSPCPNGEPSLSGEFLYEVREGEDLWNEDTDAYAGYFGDEEPKCGDQAPHFHDCVMGVVLSELSGSTRLALLGDSGTLAVRYEPDPNGVTTLFLAGSSRSLSR